MYSRSNRLHPPVMSNLTNYTSEKVLVQEISPISPRINISTGLSPVNYVLGQHDGSLYHVLVMFRGKCYDHSKKSTQTIRHCLKYHIMMLTLEGEREQVSHVLSDAVNTEVCSTGQSSTCGMVHCTGLICGGICWQYGLNRFSQKKKKSNSLFLLFVEKKIKRGEGLRMFT